jgi:hypothetical protein
VVGILRCACRAANIITKDRDTTHIPAGGALSRLCIRSAAPRKRREELDARSHRLSHTSRINATITVTFIPVNELTLFFFCFSSFLRNGLTSSLQASRHVPFHRCCLNQCLLFLIFCVDNNPHIALCADHSGDPSRARPAAAGLLQDCECQLKAPPVSLLDFPQSFCSRTSSHVDVDVSASHGSVGTTNRDLLILTNAAACV